MPRPPQSHLIYIATPSLPVFFSFSYTKPPAIWKAHILCSLLSVRGSHPSSPATTTSASTLKSRSLAGPPNNAPSFNHATMQPFNHSHIIPQRGTPLPHQIYGFLFGPTDLIHRYYGDIGLPLLSDQSQPSLHESRNTLLCSLQSP